MRNGDDDNISEFKIQRGCKPVYIDFNPLGTRDADGICLQAMNPSRRRQWLVVPCLQVLCEQN
jgi:hypothetical protein